MTDVREELELAEARVVQLRKENAALARRLVKPTAARDWTLGAVLVGGLAATFTFCLADRSASRHAAAEQASAEQKHAIATNRLRIDTLSCTLDVEKATTELARCVFDGARDP